MDTEKIFCMFENNIIYYIGLNNDIEHTEILILYTKKNGWRQIIGQKKH